MRQCSIEALSNLTQSAVHGGSNEDERDKLLLALLSIACSQQSLDRVEESVVHEVNVSTVLSSIDKGRDVTQARVDVELGHDTLALFAT